MGFCSCNLFLHVVQKGFSTGLLLDLYFLSAEAYSAVFCVCKHNWEDSLFKPIYCFIKICVFFDETKKKTMISSLPSLCFCFCAKNSKQTTIKIKKKTHQQWHYHNQLPPKHTVETQTGPDPQSLTW